MQHIPYIIVLGAYVPKLPGENVKENLCWTELQAKLMTPLERTPSNYVVYHNNFTNSRHSSAATFRDHRWKGLGEENSDLLGLFLCGPFSPPFSK